MDPYTALLPRPVTASSRPGWAALDSRTTLDATAPPEVLTPVRSLLAELAVPYREATSRPLDTTETVWVTAGLDPALPDGAYTLDTAERAVAVRAGGREGLAAALVALRQLLPAAAWRRTPRPPAGGWRLPCGRIEDRPAYPWRGAMLDVVRHFLPKHEVLRHVDLLAAHRFNRLHLHLTDDQGWRVESRAHPRLHEVGAWRPQTRLGPDGPADGTPHGGFYTLDDLAEIAAHARARGITLVPEVDVPGHTSALRAAHPELGRPGEAQAVLDTVWAGGTSLRPTRDVAAFLCGVLDEIADATGSPWLHLGGDECPMDGWPDDPSVRAEMAEHGFTDHRLMHGRFLRTLQEHLAGRGVRALVWDEALNTGGVLPGSVVTAWRGDGVAARAAAGHDVVRTPLFPTYFNFGESDDPDEPRSEGGPITLRDVAAFEPAPADWPAESRGRVLGGQFQVWSEWVPDGRRLDALAYPRACAMAEVLWSGGVPDPAEFERRLADHHLPRLDALGVEYRPPGGLHPWQRGGTGVRRRTGPGRIAETRRWIESVSREEEPAS